MAKKETKAISVITIPLITEKWQEDVLFKRFEVCRSIYNAMLGGMLKEYRKMTHSKEYKDAQQIINDTYKQINKLKAEPVLKQDEKKRDKEINKLKKTDAYTNAVNTCNDLRKAYGFSEFGFIAASNKYSEHFRGIVPTKLAELSIAKPMWAAFEKMIFNKSEGEKRPMPHFKKYNTFSSVVTDGRSGIRIVDENNKTTKKMDSSQKYFVLMTSKKGKSLRMPLKIDRKNTYLLEMMERDIHTVRIIRKKVKGNYRYLAQLSVTGVPAEKYDKDGNLKHTVGHDKEVGIYINTRSIVAATKEGTIILNLNNPNKYIDQINEIQKYMDNSKRATNPDNFNEDGTVKKGVKLTWNYSNGYKRARDKKANLERIMAEQRKIRANIIANQIIAMGTNVVVNDYSFAKAAEKSKEDKKTKKGTYASKHKAGKTIAENAPSMIITILDNKLKALGYNGVIKEKVEILETETPGLNEFYANQMLAKCCDYIAGIAV